MEGEGGVEPTTHSYAALLRACSGAAGRRAAASTSPELSRSFLGALLVGAGDWRTAVQLLRRMERLELKAEIWGDMGRYGEIWLELKAEAVHHGLAISQPVTQECGHSLPQAEAVHYGLAINACSRGGEDGKIMSLLREMQGMGLHPDVATFTTALSVCAANNQLPRALSLIERMYSLEVAPDVATYNVLLQACDLS